MFHLIGFIIFGLVVGLIARAVTPGRQHMTWISTAILGIVGSLIAGYLGQAFGWYDADQAGGFIASTIGAVVLLSVYHLIMKDRSSRLGSSSIQKESYPRKVA